MTSTVKVTSHNYPVLVMIDDGRRTREEVVTPQDGERHYHCTTDQKLSMIDIAYDDHRVPAGRYEKDAHGYWRPTELKRDGD